MLTMRDSAMPGRMADRTHATAASRADLPMSVHYLSVDHAFWVLGGEARGLPSSTSSNCAWAELAELVPLSGLGRSEGPGRKCVATPAASS